jgi:signal transduction histidine kinase/CheY-like chemotaxis protein
LQLINFAIEALLALVFAGVLITAIRDRDPLAWDVTLVTFSLGQLLILQLIQAAFGTLPLPITIVAIVLLLAQPVFVLRLVSRFRSVPRWLVPLSALALLATVGLFAVAGQSNSRPAGIALVVEFAIADAVAAGLLVWEARRRVGSARIRLAIAALSTVAIALVFVLSVASPSSSSGTAQTSASSTAAPSVLQIVDSLIALGAALGYVVAFLPPRWLRRTWLASALFTHSQAILAAPPSEDDAALWGRLIDAAESTTAGTAVVIEADENGSAWIAAGHPPFAPGPLPAGAAAAPSSANRGGSTLIPVPTGNATIDELAGRIGARYGMAVVIRGVTIHPTLVLLSAYPSLFGADDADLLGALGTRTALQVERRRVLADQEHLTDRLAATVGELQKANQAKSDFLASMSHELRTPLSAIIGFSDLMRHEPKSPDGGLIVPDDWVENIHRSGQHLLGLINDVLDLAKVEAGRLELNVEPVDVEAAVVESVAGLRPLALRKSLELEVNTDSATIVADRGRLRQILYNLLSNAIKYTPTGGRITIRASRSGDELYLSVADTGVGISTADQAHIFEEFKQLGDPSAREPGTGLGLALTKRLVEAHEGRIEVESEPGVGSTFTVVLPRASDLFSLAEVPATERVAGSHAPGDVLVIEDDESVAALLRAYLEADGYSVRIAHDGEAGLAAAREQPPAAILLDVVLPGMDGWDVLNTIKLDGRLRTTPVVFLSVLDEREIGLALGAVDYLVKPVDRRRLLECLDRIMVALGPNSMPVRVLAIDDDAAALDLIQASLNGDRYEVIRATGGAEGLTLARSVKPDLVICDLLMPHVDGFGVVAGLKADEATRSIPILVLTAHTLTAEEKVLLNGNILGVLDKGETGKEGLRAWLSRVIGTETQTGLST